MIARRVWHKWPLVNGGRWISPYTSSAPSPLAVHSFHNSPFRVSTFELVSFSTAASTWFRFADQISNCRITYNVNGRWFSSEAMADVAAGGNGNGIVDVPLAQTGEGIAECKLLKWFVREGDQVDKFQPLCEVQSDKATIEITSRYLGKVSQLLYVPGDIIKMAVEESQVPKQICESLENTKLLDSELNTHHIGGVLSTPPVRNLAKHFDIDINEVCGTGKDGRVLKEDVTKYAALKGIIEVPSVSLSASPEKALGGEDSYAHT